MSGYPDLSYRINTRFPRLVYDPLRDMSFRKVATPTEEPCEPVPPQYYDLITWFNLPLPDYSFAFEPEEKERKIDAVLQKLKEGVARIHDSAVFREFLLTMSKFHEYSIGNQILIMLQRPGATMVAGFVTWKELGRYVKAGEKGIQILAPCLPAKRLQCPVCNQEFIERELGKHLSEVHQVEPADIVKFIRLAKAEAPIEPAPRYFKVVYVFDISQTEGKPLPEFVVPALTGAVNEDLFVRLLALDKELGIKVSFEPKPDLDPELKGYYVARDREIWVKPDEPRAQQLKTLLHENAHHYSETVFEIPKADAETIAESAAFVVGAHFGFDTGTRSFPYVALWAADKEVLERNLLNIRKVSARMIEALEKIAPSPLRETPEHEINQIVADLNLLREEKIWIDTFKTKGASVVHLQTGETATIVSPPQTIYPFASYEERAMHIRWADGSEMIVDANDFGPSALQERIAEVTHGKPIPPFPEREKARLVLVQEGEYEIWVGDKKVADVVDTGPGWDMSLRRRPKGTEGEIHNWQLVPTPEEVSKGIGGASGIKSPEEALQLYEYKRRAPIKLFQFNVTFANKDTGERRSVIVTALDERDATKIARRQANLSDRWIADKVTKVSPLVEGRFTTETIHSLEELTDPTAKRPVDKATEIDRALTLWIKQEEGLDNLVRLAQESSDYLPRLHRVLRKQYGDYIAVYRGGPARPEREVISVSTSKDVAAGFGDVEKFIVKTSEVLVGVPTLESELLVRRASLLDRPSTLLEKVDSKWRTADEIASAANVDTGEAHRLLDKLWKEGKVGKAKIYDKYERFFNNQPVSCPKCGGWQVEQFLFGKDRPVFSYQCHNYPCLNYWEGIANPHGGRSFVVNMTKAETDWAHWAISPMPDYFQELLRDEEIKEIPPLPRIEGNNLILPDNPDVIADLLYRLEQQAPDVCETDAASAIQAAARCRPALKLARKIRDMRNPHGQSSQKDLLWLVDYALGTGRMNVFHPDYPEWCELHGEAQIRELTSQELSRFHDLSQEIVKVTPDDFLRRGESEQAARVERLLRKKGDSPIIHEAPSLESAFSETARTTFSPQERQYLDQLINEVPDVNDTGAINYWVKWGDRWVYLEGWIDKCLAGTGFPPMAGGEWDAKIDYMVALTRRTLIEKQKEKKLTLIEGGFRAFDAGSKDWLYGVTWGVYTNGGLNG